eukprot:2993291-Alexandrium_andersonii.AAC.1
MSTAGRSRLQSWLQELRAEGGALPPDCPSWQRAALSRRSRQPAPRRLGWMAFPTRPTKGPLPRGTSSKPRHKP